MRKEMELLEGLRNDVNELQFRNQETLDAYRRRTEMLARRIFGEGTKYLKDLEEIRFAPGIYFSGMSEDLYRSAWDRGMAKLLNLIDTMREELAIFGAETQTSSADVAAQPEAMMKRSIFVVHGHDDEMKQSVARILEKLGLNTIILHEQPNKGRTIIEKFMDYGEVASFAIVLLSPDDLAYDRNSAPETASYRARQNVVLDLGFFLGKLGPSQVMAMHREADRFEMPSDYSGVLFVPFDRRGMWQFELVRELKAAGHDVDANALT